MPSPSRQRKLAVVGSRSVGKLQQGALAPLSSSPYQQSHLRALFLVTSNHINDHISLSGKSALTVQFVEGHFVESYYPTIENTFSRNISYKGQDFATEIIDTAGQVS